jgi:hypothetical protein
MRRLAIAAIMVCFSTTPVFAQDTTFTVSATGADVYRSPSTGSPVIGRAPGGAVVPVSRELGSWVRISWPAAADGVGYLHVSTGRVANGAPVEAVRAAAGSIVRATADVSSGPTRPPASEVTAARAGNVARRRDVTPVPHILGIGGELVTGSPLGFGGTARAWRGNRLGLRVDVSHYAMATVPTGRVSAVQVAPSVLVSLGDHISEYFWLRPYVGTGVSLQRQTPGDNSLGLQTFGGGELTHASAPQLSLSADFGYRSSRSTFDVFDAGGFGASVSAHWYFR